MASAGPGYKPSSFSSGSQRASPFRRPSSPASPSPLRQSTPLGSPTRAAGIQSVAGSRLSYQSTPATAETWTPKAQFNLPDTSASTATASRPPLKTANSRGVGSNNAMSQLPPSQVRMLREGFQILDRDSDGVVGREDVADMLNQLGLPANPSDVSPFFPPASPQTTTFAAFLSSLSAVLAALSPSAELLSAFSAFDDDDSGQVDLVELRDALLHTAPEPGERALTEDEIDRVMDGFTGRRAFSKGNSKLGGLGKRGEVFKYQEFVQSILGGSNGKSEAADSEEEV
ncbi:hypothetical protein MCOR25_003431 [Pyricularia grisea]|nr:hypothetical protein MCOR25_003431 [Pyricularia grisea]